MNEIFGIPMSAIMAVLLVMLGICLLVVLWIAWRRTLLFKMGLRNVPRRPAQTVLVIIGLMLSTLIIAAAFGTGDTIDNSVTSLTYETLGPVDELVLYSNSEDGEANLNGGENQTIPSDTVQRIDQLFEGTGLIHATMPMLWEEVPVFLFDGEAPTSAQEMLAAAQDGRILQAEPSSNLLGIDPALAPEFGGLTSLDGSPIDLATVTEGQVVISESMADELGAEVGSNIGFSFNNIPMSAIGGRHRAGFAAERRDRGPNDRHGHADRTTSSNYRRRNHQHGGYIEHRDDARQPRERRRNRGDATGGIRGRSHRSQCHQAGLARSGRVVLKRVYLALRGVRALFDRRRHSAHHPDLFDAGCRAALRNGDGARGRRAARAARAAIPERGDDLCTVGRAGWRGARCWRSLSDCVRAWAACSANCSTSSHMSARAR